MGDRLPAVAAGKKALICRLVRFGYINHGRQGRLWALKGIIVSVEAGKDDRER